MKVHVMGASGTYPVPGRPASGYLIEHDGTRIWCDAGPGTFVKLPVDPDLVDAIVVSHQHPDHSTDVLTAFHSWSYRPDPRRGVPLYAAQAVWDRFSAYLDKGQGSAFDLSFDFTPVGTGDTATVGDIDISFVDVDHSVPTIGSRYEANNRSLFFTGDTGPAGSWRDTARGVDVLLSEATYQGEPGSHPYPHHLTASEAGQIAREVGAARLVLTHIPPYLDVARSVHEAELEFDRPVGLAVPGGQIDV